MSRDFLPHQGTSLTDASARTTNPFYVWFQGLERILEQSGADLTSLQEQINALRDEIANLPGGEVFLHQMGSVRIDGKYPNFYLSLQGDSFSPGNTYYYGTGQDGEKGWFTIASALAVEPRLEMVVGEDGVVTFDLAEVANSGIGASPVKLYTRDAYGRIEGDQDATTDELPEGVANLYFTDERAQDAVGGIVGNTADIELTYDDGTPSITGLLAAAIHASLDLADTSIQPGDSVSDLANDAGYITDAPSDGTPYARQDAGWVAAGGGGSGTVTSVNVSGGTTGLDVTGGPITGSGTMTIELPTGEEFHVNVEGIMFGAHTLGVSVPGSISARLWGLPDASVHLAGVDVSGVLRWNDAIDDKAELVLPVFAFGFGNAGMRAHIESGLTTNRTYQLRDASGVLALVSDITTMWTANPSANEGVYWTGVGSPTAYSLTAGGRALGGVAGTANTAPYFSASNTVSLQATSVSGRNLWNVAGTANNIAYLSSANTWTLTSITAFGRSLIALADASAARAGLGVDTSSSGTYTPTVTNINNTSARSGNDCQWLRVGDVVTVSGSFNVTAASAAGTQTEVILSLPVASNLTVASHAGGAGNFVLGALVTPCVIFGNVASDVAQVRWASASASAGAVYFSFTYRVI